MAIRVFLVDDHELVRLGLRDAVTAEDDFAFVGEASNAAEAIERIPDAEPDVAVIDVRLGQAADGISICREVRAAHPEIQCLMLTSYPGDEALFDSIMAGASGYLLKEIPVSDLLAAIRRVAVGESLIDPAMTARLLERIRTPIVADSRRDGRPLTPQERNILTLIAEGKTNREIGGEMGLAEKTVKYYVSNLLAKLGMHRRSQAAAYAARLSERTR